MLFLYKDLKLCLTILSCIGGCLGVFALNNNIHILLVILCTMIYCLLISLICSNIALKRINKLTNDMVEKCEIEKSEKEFKRMVEISEKIYAKNATRATKKQEEFLKHNLAVAYIHGGKFEEALRILKCIDQDFKEDINEIVQQFLYYNNLLITYLELGKIEEASKLLENMKKTLETAPIKEKDKESFEYYYENKKMLLELSTKITEENLKKAETFYLNDLEKSNKKIEKVFSHYMLAEIYQQLGNEEKKEKSIYYVLENGGDTYYVQEVKKLKDS